MTTLAQGVSVQVTIPAGQRLFIAPGSSSRITRHPDAPREIGFNGGTYGPVRNSTDIQLASLSGTVNYFIQSAAGEILISSTAPINNDGMPDGTIVLVPQ